MAQVTLGSINSAIHDALAAADGIEYSQDFDQITEGIINTPVLQVYFQDKETSFGSANQQHTFRQGIRQTEYTFHADLYLDQRAWSDKIFSQMYPLIDAIDEVFEAQIEKPYFDLAAIKSFHYRADRVNFEYGKNKFPGVRWTLNIRVF